MPDLLTGEPWVCYPLTHEANVSHAIFHPLEDRLCIGHPRMDLHSGLLGAEGGQCPGKQAFTRQRTGSDRDHGPLALSHRRHCPLHPFGGLQNALSMTQENLAGGGQRDMPRIACEEFEAKVLLQLLDLLTDGWAGQSGQLGSPSETSVLRH